MDNHSCHHNTELHVEALHASAVLAYAVAFAGTAASVEAAEFAAASSWSTDHAAVPHKTDARGGKHASCTDSIILYATEAHRTKRSVINRTQNTPCFTLLFYTCLNVLWDGQGGDALWIEEVEKTSFHEKVRNTWNCAGGHFTAFFMHVGATAILIHLGHEGKPTVSSKVHGTKKSLH
eukprot:4014586-Amphidinium_carterae.1